MNNMIESSRHFIPHLFYFLADICSLYLKTNICCIGYPSPKNRFDSYGYPSQKINIYCSARTIYTYSLLIRIYFLVRQLNSCLFKLIFIMSPMIPSPRQV